MRYTLIMPKRHEEQLQNAVQKQRKNKGLTQQELADAVNVTRQTIIAIEKGNYVPSVVLALNIAQYFDTSIEDLFFYQ